MIKELASYMNEKRLNHSVLFVIFYWFLFIVVDENFLFLNHHSTKLPIIIYGEERSSNGTDVYVQVLVNNLHGSVHIWCQYNGDGVD